MTTRGTANTRAAACLRDWQREGVLVQDSARALYVYHQEFEVEGRRYTRRGFMAGYGWSASARARCSPRGNACRPKADRLKLFRATNMNLSQVFGLYHDYEGRCRAS